MSDATKWPGRTARGSVLLPVPWSFVPPLAAHLELPEARLDRKHELHLTLLSRKEAERVAATTDPAEWHAWFARHDWTMRLTDRWTLLRDVEDGETVHSVVAEVDCPALDAFRTEVGYAAATVLEPTLPHVTLWVAGTKGIGLASYADVERTTIRALSAPEREAGIDAR
jgi:hypothetical protein